MAAVCGVLWYCGTAAFFITLFPQNTMPFSASLFVPVFGLIVVGDEILSGRRADRHLPHCADLLAQRGLHLSWARYVGDEPQRLTHTIRQAWEEGGAVFCTGGIGATPDDYTRQCAAEALGVPIEPHAEAIALIDARSRAMAQERGLPYDPEAPDNRQRRIMGHLPRGAWLLPNPYNGIAGFALGQPGEGRVLYFMPGFPVMAWPMMEQALGRDWAACFAPQCWQERSIIVRGEGEAVLTPLMERIEAQHPQVKVFSLPSMDHPEYGRHIELGVKGSPAAVAPAWAALKEGLAAFSSLRCGPEFSRP